MRQKNKHSLKLLVVLSVVATTFVPPVEARHWHSCFGKTVTIRGTYRADILEGTTGNDVFVAQGGNDLIFADGGNDRLCGGRGDDTLIGGDGFDRAQGNSGTDTCDAERRKKCEQ